MSSVCEHGAERERHKSYGDVVFACPLGTCSCCGTIFPYADSSQTVMRKENNKWFDVSDVSSWTPTDRCGPCGGQYVQTHTEEEFVD